MGVPEIVTEKIIQRLEQGVVPWHMPWRRVGVDMTPANLVSKKAYKGVNVLLLGCQGYSSRWWLSYKQAQKLGGQVRKGEKSTPIIFWKVTDSKTKVRKDGSPDKAFILRYYNGFNALQCDGLKLPEEPKVENAPTFDPIEKCEQIVRAYKTIPAIDHGGDRACYSPTFDRVSMPHKEAFDTREAYYATLFHELVHSTGHEMRLKRDGIMNPIRFGSHDYSFEELVAECGSAFLCSHAGIIDHTLDNSAAYIASWIKKLQSEPKWVVEASGKATKAMELIMGDLLKEEEESADDEEAA